MYIVLTSINFHVTLRSKVILFFTEQIHSKFDSKLTKQYNKTITKEAQEIAQKAEGREQ